MTATHIFGRSCLKVDRTGEQFLQCRENPVIFKDTLKAAQEPENKFDLPPSSIIDVNLQRLAEIFKKVGDELRFQGIGDEDDGRNERDLQGLLKYTSKDKIISLIANMERGFAHHTFQE